ncbi:MAG: hypothetical protein ISR65_11825 [Bacteriovoracaceae bacterium]|nr:hypothetical protein [Bacteriovoracaceae bacterium]
MITRICFILYALFISDGLYSKRPKKIWPKTSVGIYNWECKPKLHDCNIATDSSVGQMVMNLIAKYINAGIPRGKAKSYNTGTSYDSIGKTSDYDMILGIYMGCSKLNDGKYVFNVSGGYVDSDTALYEMPPHEIRVKEKLTKKCLKIPETGECISSIITKCLKKIFDGLSQRFAVAVVTNLNHSNYAAVGTNNSPRQFDGARKTSRAPVKAPSDVAASGDDLSDTSSVKPR